MQFEWKLSTFIVMMALACTDEDEDWTSLRNHAHALPDTTLPDDSHKGKKPKHEPRKGDAFRKGVVTTSEPLAAKVGAEVLDDGGNAIDAAIAVMFMNNVVEPQSSGIGGGGFMMIHLADSDETHVLNCRELSPE